MSSATATLAPYAISVTPPVIPPMVVGPLTEEQEPVLLWVHTGAATVQAGGSTYRLAAGEAIWVPPGVEHCTRTDEGAVVIPFFSEPAELTGALAEVHVVAIPPGWVDWLIHRWDDNSYTRDVLPGSGALLRLIAQIPAVGDRTPAGLRGLPLPRSREALFVARALLRNPGSMRDAEEFAARENISGKTLQRQFLHETGMTFSVWRTRARIAAAARHLDEGRPIGWTGRHVGYGTPTGFTKAFRRHTALTPREYVRCRSGRPAELVIEDEPSVEDAIGLAAGAAEAVPRVPARSFWDRVNPRHELMWVYRGEVQLRIGTRRWTLQQNQLIWVPAGLTHSVEFAAGSLMMTVGTRHGRVQAGVDELTVFTFPPAAEPFLLHTMLSEFTLFRPETGRGALTAELFHEQFRSVPPGAGALTGVLGDIAAALHRDPADPRSLAGWAAQLQTTPELLGREFMTQTGDTFPLWRARIRMHAARELLLFGESPGQVYRQLGYTSAAAFSRAFTTAHGISPREYQRRENRRAEAGG